MDRHHECGEPFATIRSRDFLVILSVMCGFPRRFTVLQSKIPVFQTGKENSDVMKPSVSSHPYYTPNVQGGSQGEQQTGKENGRASKFKSTAITVIKVTCPDLDEEQHG